MVLVEENGGKWVIERFYRWRRNVWRPNLTIQTFICQTFISKYAPYTTYIMVCQTLKPYKKISKFAQKTRKKYIKGLINI